jgi:hypothetical protein
MMNIYLLRFTFSLLVSGESFKVPTQSYLVSIHHHTAISNSQRVSSRVSDLAKVYLQWSSRELIRSISILKIGLLLMVMLRYQSSPTLTTVLMMTLTYLDANMFRMVTTIIGIHPLLLSNSFLNSWKCWRTHSLRPSTWLKSKQTLLSSQTFTTTVMLFSQRTSREYLLDITSQKSNGTM